MKFMDFQNFLERFIILWFFFSFLGFFIFFLPRYLEYGMVGIFAPYLFGAQLFGKVGRKQISINFGLTWDHKSD